MCFPDRTWSTRETCLSLPCVSDFNKCFSQQIGVNYKRALTGKTSTEKFPTWSWFTGGSEATVTRVGNTSSSDRLDFLCRLLNKIRLIKLKRMEKQLKKRLKLKWTTFIIMHFVYETSAYVLEHTKWRPGSFTKVGNERCLETSMVLTESPRREERVHSRLHSRCAVEEPDSFRFLNNLKLRSCN